MITREMQECIDYALHLCADSAQDYYWNLQEPFLQQDGIVATDGKVLLYYKTKHTGMLSMYKPQSRPNTAAVTEYEKVYAGRLSRDEIFLKTPLKEDIDVMVAGVRLEYSRFIQVMNVMQILGLDGFEVYKEANGGRTKLMFIGETGGDDEARLLVMGLSPKKNIESQDVLLQQDCESMIQQDWSQANIFMIQHKERQARKEAEDAVKRKGNLWEVRVQKTGYFYVEAKDEEEAAHIAGKAFNDIDDDDIFEDSDAEIEAVEGEATLDDVPDSGDLIWSGGEVYDKDGYIDALEE